MNRLEQIEKSVSELSSDELDAFARWFEALQAKRWDEAFDQDVQAGRLDAAADAALATLKAGKTRPL